MSFGVINGYDFGEMEAMKYYAPPAAWSQEKNQTNVQTKVFSGQWLAAEKMDGYFSCFIKDDDGNIILKTRSRGVDGTFANKYEWVPHLHDFFGKLPNGTCLLGELYLPSKPGSKNITSLLGCLKEKCVARQEKDEKLHFYIFDVLAYCGVNYINTAAAARFQLINGLFEDFGNEEYIDFAHYFRGEALWDLIGEILERGGEGVVLTKEDAHYEPGKRPSKTTLKVKKEISQHIDCFFTGRGTQPTKIYEGKELPTWPYWVNAVDDSRLPIGEHYFDYINQNAAIIPVTKPYYNKWCGSLEIGLVKDEKVVPIGYLSGLTDEIKANPLIYKGKVIEVSAMEIGYNEDGSFSGLRHPKMICFRDDKPMKDCTYDQLL